MKKRDVKILVSKAAIMPLIRRATAQTKSLCENSCRPGPHVAECLRDKAEDRIALAAIRNAKVVNEGSRMTTQTNKKRNE